MRLGFWNRLAVVAWALGSLCGATYTVLSANDRSYKAMAAGYDVCMSRVGQGDGSITADWCYQNWMTHIHTWGVADWAAFTGLYALVGAALYLLIWAAVATGKWVWRGRTPK